MRETTFLEVCDVAQHQHSGQFAFRLRPSREVHFDADVRGDFVVVVNPEQVAEIATAIAKLMQDR